ncbi:HAD family hydrolase [Flammeovirga sp. EKP202]|uniref:HAD family hydrolase n=1 Tax=Flammeovirga sp. EKP202 TaxID=2770592 RepID=UPI00165FCF08|nr:HAD hydrolase-like protein [Flammeovirga sp. EKP202]MBD0402483.1 HAD hydrolase-like protein [Flammeovirga sp. EKP202]
MNLIVFDIDGTLTDSVKVHINAFLIALKQLGVKEEGFNFKTYKHHTDSYISKVIYEEYVQKEFTSEVQEQFASILYSEINKHEIKEIKGASQLIQSLQKDENYGICYATGSIIQPAKLKLEVVGASYDPSQLVPSNDIYERENIVSKAIENAKEFYQVEQFDKIYSIGDGLWDLKTAQNLELEFIGIGEENEAIMRENGMQTFYKDLTEFELPL